MPIAYPPRWVCEECRQILPIPEVVNGSARPIASRTNVNQVPELRKGGAHEEEEGKGATGAARWPYRHSRSGTRSCRSLTQVAISVSHLAQRLRNRRRPCPHRKA